MPSSNVNATTSATGTTRKREPRRARKRVGASPAACDSFERAILRAARLAPDAIERRRQAGAVHGLQQIIERRQFEGVDGVLIVGGAEDHRRPRPAERRGHIKAAGARHLNIQQHDIGSELGDPLGGLHAILGFAGDLHVRMRRQQLAQPLACWLFIVNQQRSESSGQPSRPSPSHRPDLAVRRGARGPRREWPCRAWRPSIAVFAEDSASLSSPNSSSVLSAPRRPRR